MLDSILTDEQKLLKNVLHKFTEDKLIPGMKEWDKLNGYPGELLEEIKGLGLLGLTIPEEYGGNSGGTLDVVILMEETSRCGTMVIPMTHVGVVASALIKFGTSAQKEKYLRPMASGDFIGAFAQTEPNAGSDVGNMSSYAELKDGSYYIHGTKHFISFSDIGNLFVVVAKTLKGIGTKGISMFLVEKDFPGFSISKIEEKMGWHVCGTGELVFEDCRVPEENLLVPQGHFKEMMGIFNGERCANSATCLGIAQGAWERAVKFAQERYAFGKPISDNQGLRWMLADMAVELQAARLLIYDAAYKHDQGRNIAKEIAIAKLYTNEMAQRVTNMAIQIHGGYGYMREYQVERYLRDVRGLAFGGGTPQILRDRVAIEIFKNM
ncbi:MAG: acyl-CoA dehydrogenase family protein [Bacillota bacterium]